MRELPTILNTEMVKAVLTGNKTQTRRPIKCQSRKADHFDVILSKDNSVFDIWDLDDKENILSTHKMPCQIGDTLYVRETMVINKYLDIYYKADNTAVMDDWMNEQWVYRKPEFTGEVPSIHMPKKAARIFLKVTNVRVERVQSITNQGIINEGVGSVGIDNSQHSHQHILNEMSFKKLWNSIYKNWDSNPWVWVIDFEVVKK